MLSMSKEKELFTKGNPENKRETFSQETFLFLRGY